MRADNYNFEICIVGVDKDVLKVGGLVPSTEYIACGLQDVMTISSAPLDNTPYFRDI
jgi:hypothetical protein